MSGYFTDPTRGSSPTEGRQEIASEPRASASKGRNVLGELHDALEQSAKQVRDEDAQNPPCLYCGKQTRIGGLIKMTLWRQNTEDYLTCRLDEQEVVIHQTCVWPYLDTHPRAALSRF